MDKKLIERIVLGTYQEVVFPLTRKDLTEFVTHCLARIDAAIDAQKGGA